MGTILGDLAPPDHEDRDAYATGVTGDGTVIGMSYADGEGYRAVRWHAGQTEPTQLDVLGTDSQGHGWGSPRASNSFGAIVGESIKYDAGGASLGQRAVYWAPDSTDVLDLNTLIDPSSGWLLEYARGISENGWIAGVGQFDPDGAGGALPYTRNFVLQVPEPAAASVLSVLMVALISRRTRQLNTGTR